MYRTIYEKVQNQWNGVKTRPLYNPDISLGEAFLKSMQIHAAKLAQVSCKAIVKDWKQKQPIISYSFLKISDDSGARLTFGQIRARTIRIAINLQKRDYKARQVFTIIARNTENLVSVVFAAFCLGCPINPLDTSFGHNEIKHMLSITKPSLIFCDVDVHEKVVQSLQSLGSEAKIITMNGKVDSYEQVEDLLVATGEESIFR